MRDGRKMSGPSPRVPVRRPSVEYDFVTYGAGGLSRSTQIQGAMGPSRRSGSETSK